MTLEKRAELIAESAGRQFDRPFRDKISDLIVVYRSKFLTDAIKKDRSLKRLYSTAITVELDELSKDECEELETCKDSKVYRTKSQIPRVLRVGPNPFDYVGTMGGAQAYGITSFAAEPYLKQNRYTGKNTRYTLLNDYIYLFNPDNISTVRVEDVWDDPRQLANFKCPGNIDKPCYSDENDFPIDEKLFELIKTSILQIDLRVLPVPEKPENLVEIKPDSNV